MSKSNSLSIVQGTSETINPIYTTTTSSNQILTVSGTNSTWVATSGSGNFTITSSKTKYTLLGKEIEVDGYKDFNVALSISLINTLGIKFYDEMKKQDIHFPKEIEEFLKKEIVIYYRNKTIEEIIK